MLVCTQVAVLNIVYTCISKPTIRHLERARMRGAFRPSHLLEPLAIASPVPCLLVV